jgi:hypothetical protein
MANQSRFCCKNRQKNRQKSANWSILSRLIARLIGLINRDKIVDFRPILTIWALFYDIRYNRFIEELQLSHTTSFRVFYCFFILSAEGRVLWKKKFVCLFVCEFLSGSQVNRILPLCNFWKNLVKSSTILGRYPRRFSIPILGGFS